MDGPPGLLETLVSTMIRALGKEVRKTLKRRMKESFPLFEFYKAPFPTPDLYLYCWPFAEDMRFYVGLDCPSRHDAIFTINLAWSDQEQWERHDMCMGPDEAPSTGVVHFRLDELLENRPQFGVWWDFGPLSELSTVAHLDTDTYLKYFFFQTDSARDAFVESALPLVPRAIDDAIEHIRKYAIPYFQSIAEKRGYGDRWQQYASDDNGPS